MTKYKSNFLYRVLPGVILCVVLFYISSCSQRNYVSKINYDFRPSNNKPDYGNLNYWAASPFKYDPSDNVPSDLRNESKDSLADVFFIYPTTYTDPKMPMGWNADINNEALNSKTDKSTILYQASVFNKYCRVFAPRYRQANLEAFFTADHVNSNAAFDTAYADVRAAFIYYLKYYNRGRPIIIASHSQGTRHAGQLLREFFDGKPLQKQLVCAYIIGLPVFTNYFCQLKPCEDSMATGCFITWRTFEQGYISPVVAREKLKSYVINPLSWTMDTLLAPARLNNGGILRNFNKVIPRIVQAQIHGNILWVNKPRFFGSIFLKTKNYHIADYNLFYENIRENAGTRIHSYLNKESKKK
jgi:Protein of unknown function (DUF3089)